MLECGYLLRKLYNQTTPNKGSQFVDSPASTFEGLRYREIDLIVVNRRMKKNALLMMSWILIGITQ